MNLKKRVWVTAVLGVALLAATVGAQQKKLNLFIWSEYIDAGVIKDFEKQTSSKVNVSLYESNEDLLAKLAAGGTKQYDVVVPSGYVIPVMIKQNLLRPLDLTKLPNLKNLSKAFSSPSFDPGNKYSAAYLFSLTGVTYRKDKIKSLDPSWALFFDKAKQPGTFTMLDDSRSMIGIALKYLGKSYNSTDTGDIKKAVEILIDAKSRSLGFTGSPEGKNRVLSKQAVMAVTYNVEALKGMEEDKNLGFFIPKEGAEIALDNMAIPAQSPNSDLAHLFINFVLDAKIAAKNATSVRASTPNEAAKAFIPKADRDNPVIYPSDATLKTLEFATDLGASLKLYDAAWTKIKAR